MATSAPRFESPAAPASRGVAGSSPRRPAARDRAVLLLVVAISAAYVLWHLRRGLIPHDDGVIGHTAERVLLGELPHRDFDDIYTGGLAWLNALGFQLLGTSVLTMRLVLVAAFLAWLPAQYYIARRFVGPFGAAAVTLASAVWSVPNYPAPMPSWYNLFLATFGAAALMRYLERRQARWLVAGGVAGGLSVLFKVIGLYYVAGVLLFLVYEAHAQSRTIAGAQPARGTAYLAFVAASLALFVVALVGLVSRQPAAPELVHFLLPGALIAAMLVSNEATRPAGDSVARVRVLARLVGPFLLGLALPIALFVLPYALSGAVGSLLYGVFVLPTRRFGFAEVPMLPLASIVAVVPALAILAAAQRWHHRVRPWMAIVLGVLLAAAVWRTASYDAGYRFVWASVRNLVPALTMLGVVLLARPADDRLDGRWHAQVMLLLSVTALCSIVQFPFAATIYFCFVATLVILLATALQARLAPGARVMAALLLAFYAAFAVTRVNTSSVYLMGIKYNPYPETFPLTIARGGVTMYDYRRQEYLAVNELLRAHARGPYTWASPDCPEVYFLSGMRNPSRTLFEFFDDPENRDARVLAMLEAKGVTAVVLNRMPEFSRPLQPGFYRELVRRYPSAMDAGRFQVRWR